MGIALILVRCMLKYPDGILIFDMCVSVCERKRERQTETELETERQRDGEEENVLTGDRMGEGYIGVH